MESRGAFPVGLPVVRVGDEAEIHKAGAASGDFRALFEDVLLPVGPEGGDEQLVLCRAHDQLAHVDDDLACVRPTELGLDLPVALGDELEILGIFLARWGRGHAADRDVEQHFVAVELFPVLLAGGPENPISLSLILLDEAAGQLVDPFGGSISVPVSLGVPLDIPGKGMVPTVENNLGDVGAMDRHSLPLDTKRH